MGCKKNHPERHKLLPPFYPVNIYLGDCIDLLIFIIDKKNNSKKLIAHDILLVTHLFIIKDTWASQEKAKLRILEIIPEDINGNLTINFDIYI